MQVGRHDTESNPRVIILTGCLLILAGLFMVIYRIVNRVLLPRHVYSITPLRTLALTAGAALGLAVVCLAVLLGFLAWR